MSAGEWWKWCWWWWWFSYGFITCKLQHFKTDRWCRFHATLTAISLHQCQRQQSAKILLYWLWPRGEQEEICKTTNKLEGHRHLHPYPSTGTSHLKGPLSCHAVLGLLFPSSSSRSRSPRIPWIPGSLLPVPCCGSMSCAPPS